MGKRIFLTGGSGFLGRAITAALLARGDVPVVLTRDAGRARGRVPEGTEVVEGDPTCRGPWQDQVAGCDAVINLAGAGIADRRWDARYRQILFDSRVDSTANVVAALAAAPAERRPAVLVSASGVDYYPLASELADVRGGDDDAEVAEDAPPGDSFLARMCRAWEAAARGAEEHGVRVVTPRIAMVLGKDGPLARLKTPFKIFAGGRIGSGQQWFSWIHVDDAVAAFLWAIDRDDVRGPINLAAPGAARNVEFVKALGAAMRRPAWLPVPAFAVRAVAGDLAAYALDGRRVVPSALVGSGFEFRFPDLREALAAAVA
jgi:uncharacterized protein